MTVLSEVTLLHYGAFDKLTDLISDADDSLTSKAYPEDLHANYAEGISNLVEAQTVIAGMITKATNAYKYHKEL